MIFARVYHSKNLHMQGMETHQIQIKESLINILSLTNSNKSNKTHTLLSKYITAQVLNSQKHSGVIQNTSF